MKKLFYDLDSEQVLYSDFTIAQAVQSGEEYELVCTTESGIDIESRLDKLKSICLGTNVKISHLSFKSQKEYIYDEQEMAELCELDRLCSDNNLEYYISLGDASGQYQNLLIARNKIESFVEKLKKATILEDGKEVPLSPFEKYLICYRFVASRVYKESENFGDENMRNWIGVLSTDKVICTGFASLLKCVCDRVFAKDELERFTQSSEVFDKDNNYIAGHANNLVIINDPKYNLNGMFYSDACWSSQKERNDFDSSFEYCLFPITKIAKHKKYNFKFDRLFFYDYIAPNISSANDSFSREDKPVVKRIFNRFGLKSYEEMKQEAKIDEKTEAHQKKIDEYNKKLEQKSKEKIQNFIQENSLQNIAGLQIPYWYPDKYKDAEPYLIEAEKLFSELRSKQLNEELVSKLNEFFEYYQANEHIFIKLQKKADEIGLKIMADLGTVMADALVKNERKNYNYFKFKEKLKKQLEDNYMQQRQQVLTENHQFLYPEEISSLTYAKALVSVARFEGIADKQEQIDFAVKKVKQMEKLEKLDFEMSLDANVELTK